VSEGQTFCRRKRVFGMLEVSEARRLQELERENRELKRMLAVPPLKNRVLSYAGKKKAVSPAHKRTRSSGNKISAVGLARRLTGTPAESARPELRRVGQAAPAAEWKPKLTEFLQTTKADAKKGQQP
jgi:hypothetical protein